MAGRIGSEPLQMALFFTSDTHFRDASVMRIARRPFANIADHDASLIELWNETVQEQDEVWHLGDFAKGTIDQIAELLLQLKGSKHLIIGNIDLHGHSHARLKPMPRQYDVGVDAREFRPVSLPALVTSGQQRQARN